MQPKSLFELFHGCDLLFKMFMASGDRNITQFERHEITRTNHVQPGDDVLETNPHLQMWREMLQHDAMKKNKKNQCQCSKIWNCEPYLCKIWFVWWHVFVMWKPDAKIHPKLGPTSWLNAFATQTLQYHLTRTESSLSAAADSIAVEQKTPVTTFTLGLRAFVMNGNRGMFACILLSQEFADGF